MKKILLGTALLSVLSLSAQEDVSSAKWQSNTIIVDGNDNEWEQPFGLFDNKSGLVFTLTNDNKNIYLCFTDKEAIKAEKMMKAGWTLEISSSEKKRKFDAAISFPKIDDPNINMRAEFKNQVSVYKMDMAAVKTKGFLAGNGDIPLNNKEGINIGIGIDSAEKIVYEIAIPIKDLMEEDKLQLNELITLDITVNALSKPEGSSTGGGNATRGFAGGGGRMGGGMGGGRMGGGGGRRGGGASVERDNGASDRSSLYEKVSFKQKFRLVSK
jgi:hypothetical protein